MAWVNFVVSEQGLEFEAAESCAGSNMRKRRTPTRCVVIRLYSVFENRWHCGVYVKGVRKLEIDQSPRCSLTRCGGHPGGPDAPQCSFSKHQRAIVPAETAAKKIWVGS